MQTFPLETSNLKFCFWGKLRNIFQNVVCGFFLPRVLSVNMLLFLFVILGMHKKSIEAAKKMKEEESSDSNENKRDRENIRSESIAVLRAKAQQHSVKILEVLQRGDSDGHGKSIEDTNNFNNSFISDTDVTNELTRQ